MSALADREERGHGLARFLATLRERWWVILLTVVVVGGLAFAVSLLLEARYSATAQLVYSQQDADAASKALVDAGTAGLPEKHSSDYLTLQTSAFAERADLKNNAEGLIYTTEKSLEEYASALKAEDLAEIHADLEALRGILGSEDPSQIKDALQRLEGTAYRIADAIYAAQGGEKPG